MPAPTSIAAACIAMYTACGIALAQPIDLLAPLRTIGSRSLVPGCPSPAIAPRLSLPPVHEPSPVADVTLSPPGPPPVTYALLPGRWQLEGARYVWVPPETTLRRVEAQSLVEGRYVWRDGGWHWVPAHYEDN
jgi:hypothetical protein